VFLLVLHARRIHEVKEVAIPLVADIPPMEQRLNFLKEQLEVAELFSALQSGSVEEKVHIFVLPKQPDLDRILALFDVLRDTLEQDGHIASMSAIDVGELLEEDGLVSQTLSMDLVVKKEGMKTLEMLVRLAGLLTVRDVLSDDAVEILLLKTEEENPSGITALEQFLSADLLRYVRGGKRSFDDQLLRSFSSPAFFEIFQSVMNTELLNEAHRALEGNLGEMLEEQKLWPLPFISLKNAHVQTEENGWHNVNLELITYGRGTSM
jgi:mannose/fructose/N-acetylgalactosamine-specific phosphotransferase system component IIB